VFVFDDSGRREKKMAEYSVRIRGSVPVGEIPGLSEREALSEEGLRNAGHLPATTVEADTPKDAVAQALSGFPAEGSLLLVYVEDSVGRVEVFWPTGEPLTFMRQDARSVEVACSVQVTDACLGEHQSGETAVAIEGDGWACEPCAAIVAPGV
jgi:hypothetical protein